MLNTISQINPIYNYRNRVKSISFKEKTNSLPDKKDSFESMGKNQLEEKDVESKIKASKIDRIISTIAITSFIALLLCALFKKKKGSSDISDTYKYQFENLKNNPNIPTLDSCKSINEDLKIVLQKQLNLLNADKELLEEIGNPIQTNRFLLAGPPGIGKTFFSKVFSKTIDAEYLEVLFADVNSRWAGESVEKIDAMFKKIMIQAKNNPEKKYVVTFNEIDTLLIPLEQLVGGGGATHFATLRRERSTFLTYFDRLAVENPNVIVIGTTNMRPSTKNLDAATMSRFHNIIEITYPDENCLYEAMKKGLLKIKNIDEFTMNNDGKIKKLAETMSNRKFSYRDLNSVLDDAKMFYLEEKLENKDTQFKFEYLDNALKEFKYSDGERETQGLNHTKK